MRTVCVEVEADFLSRRRIRVHRKGEARGKKWARRLEKGRALLETMATRMRKRVFEKGGRAWVVWREPEALDQRE